MQKFASHRCTERFISLASDPDREDEAKTFALEHWARLDLRGRKLYDWQYGKPTRVYKRLMQPDPDWLVFVQVPHNNFGSTPCFVKHDVLYYTYTEARRKQSNA